MAVDLSRPEPEPLEPVRSMDTATFDGRLRGKAGCSRRRRRGSSSVATHSRLRCSPRMRSFVASALLRQRTHPGRCERCCGALLATVQVHFGSRARRSLAAEREKLARRSSSLPGATNAPNNASSAGLDRARTGVQRYVTGELVSPVGKVLLDRAEGAARSSRHATGYRHLGLERTTGLEPATLTLARFPRPSVASNRVQLCW
jgi:hypothetical protein